MALSKAWGNKCSYCKKGLKGDSETQIDHIIPQSIYRDEIELAKVRHDFEGGGYLIPDDANSVENLAPIHVGCNREKGDSVPRNVLYGKVLEKAKKLSPEIVKDVETVRSLKKIRDVLIGVDLLDYDNPDVQNDMLYYFSVLEKVIKEKHPDAVDIFYATLDMGDYVEADNCSMPPVSYALQDRKLRLDYESCRIFLILLYRYNLSVEEFFDELILSLDRILIDDLDGVITSEIIDREISSSPVIHPEFRFDLSLNSFRIKSGFFEIKGSLSGSGSTMIIVPDYPSDDEEHEKQAEFQFECDFEFRRLESIVERNFSKNSLSLRYIDPHVMLTSFNLDCS